VSHAALAENITQFNHALHGPGIPSIWNLSTNLGLAALNATATREAATIAYINDFRLMMYLTLLAQRCCS
jgi:DHA2 family multidrug resistance protein